MTSSSSRRRHPIGGFRDRLLTAPRLVLMLVLGVPFGAWMGLTTGLRHGKWAEALIVGVFAAVVYGAFMGVFTHRRFGRYRDAVGSVSRSDLRKAARQARQGRVPDDPEARRAAFRLLSTQLEELRRQRRWGPGFLLLIAALSVFLAATETPWWWFAVPFWLALLAFQLMAPRRLGARLELLRD